MDARLEFKLSGEAGNSLALGSLTDVLPKAAPGMDTKNKKNKCKGSGNFPTEIHPTSDLGTGGRIIFCKDTAAGGESVYGERKHLVIPNNAFILEIISHPEGV